MCSLESRKQSLVEALEKIPHKDARLKFIIEQGRSLEAMPEKFKIDQFLIKGCISKAWLFPQLGEGGKVQFYADSEAMIVKGIIGLLMKVYNHSTPSEIIGEDGSFLTSLGITEHLSMNRRNGLAGVLTMIQAYAKAFQSQNS